MATVISLFTAYWQPVLVALLAIDAALVPIFPNLTLLQKIQGWLNSAKSL
jgi:hypothetical protein